MTGADVDMESNKNIMNNLFGMKNTSFGMCGLFLVMFAVCFALSGCCHLVPSPAGKHGHFVALISPEPQTVELQATSEVYTDARIETPVGFWYSYAYDPGYTYEPNTYTYYRYACHYRVHNPVENTEPVYMYAKDMWVTITGADAPNGIPSDSDTLYDLESENLADNLVHAYSDDVHNLLYYIDEIIADCPDGVAASHTHCEGVIVVEPGESAAIYFEDAHGFFSRPSAPSIPENGSSYLIPRPNHDDSVLGNILCGGYPDDEVRCSE